MLVEYDRAETQVFKYDRPANDILSARRLPNGQIVIVTANRQILRLDRTGKEIKSESQGDGPVDATFKAIERVAKSGAELLLFSVNAVTTGTESQGEVTVRLSRGGRIVNGVGADTDVIVASAKAYISALNKLEDKTERVNPQHGKV